MDYIVVVMLTLACVYAGWELRRWHARERTPDEIRDLGPACSVCGIELPRSALRSALSNQYRCSRHKGEM